MCALRESFFFSPNCVDFLCCSRCAGHIIFYVSVFFQVFGHFRWPNGLRYHPKPDSILMPEDV